MVQKRALYLDGASDLWKTYHSTSSQNLNSFFFFFFYNWHMTGCCAPGKVKATLIKLQAVSLISAPVLLLVFWSDHIPLMVVLNVFLCPTQWLNMSLSYLGSDISCEALLKIFPCNVDEKVRMTVGLVLFLLWDCSCCLVNEILCAFSLLPLLYNRFSLFIVDWS